MQGAQIPELLFGKRNIKGEVSKLHSIVTEQELINVYIVTCIGQFLLGYAVVTNFKNLNSLREKKVYL